MLVKTLEIETGFSIELFRKEKMILMHFRHDNR